MEGFTIFDELLETIEELQNKYNELNAQTLEIVEARIEEQAQLKAYKNFINDLIKNNIINTYDLDLYLKFAC